MRCVGEIRGHHISTSELRYTFDLERRALGPMGGAGCRVCVEEGCGTAFRDENSEGRGTP
jgi:hypothetical protein